MNDNSGSSGKESSAAQHDPGRSNDIGDELVPALRLSFSTLACPNWGFEQVVQTAKQLGYEGIELRLLDGELVGPTLPSSQIGRIHRVLKSTGVGISALDSSFELASGEWKDLVAYVELADQLGAGCVRVFGGESPTATVMSAMVDTLSKALPRAESLGVVIALETHDALSRASLLASLLDQVPSTGFGIVWDIQNTYIAGEDPSDVWAAVGRRVAHVHLKDAIQQVGSSEWRLVLIGQGSVPLRDSLAVIARSSYHGWLSVEWEKKWHPEIEEPEIALPQAIKSMRHWLKEVSPAQ